MFFFFWGGVLIISIVSKYPQNPVLSIEAPTLRVLGFGGFGFRGYVVWGLEVLGFRASGFRASS